MPIYIGTSGWSYKDWKGKFYPGDLAPARFLNYYKEYFGATELNSSFYRLPQQKTVEKWVKAVPGKFRFCPKMSRYLTHLKKLHDFEEPLDRFFGRFSVMQPKTGPVLFQLPANLVFNQDLVRSLYQQLHRAYGEYRFAIEARNESWFTPGALALAKKYSVTLVIAQSAKFPYHEAITAEDIYIRFHGPGKLYGSSYSEATLLAYAKKISTWNKQGHHIWIFFNNDMDGHAVNNARTLLDMV